MVSLLLGSRDHFFGPYPSGMISIGRNVWAVTSKGHLCPRWVRRRVRRPRSDLNAKLSNCIGNVSRPTPARGCFAICAMTWHCAALDFARVCACVDHTWAGFCKYLGRSHHHDNFAASHLYIQYLYDDFGYSSHFDRSRNVFTLACPGGMFSRREMGGRQTSPSRHAIWSSSSLWPEAFSTSCYHPQTGTVRRASMNELLP
jgi:hypothetical protein